MPPICFQAKQRNGGHFEFTNQSLGIYTELCQLLFKHLLLLEPVNVAVEYFIDCSLANQTDRSVWISISPRLTLKDDTPFKVRNKWLVKSPHKYFFLVEQIRLFVVSKYEKNGTVKDVISTEAWLNNCIWFQFHLEELGRPTPRWACLCQCKRLLNSSVKNNWQIDGAAINLFQKVRKTTLIAQNNTRIGFIKVL